mgnify:CR=1 FL=1
MALGADRVAVRLQAGGVGIVAIGAANALGVHPGLQERAVDVDLLQDRAVRVVEPRAQEGELVGVVKRGARDGAAVGKGFAACVAGCAKLDFGFRRRRPEVDGEAFVGEALRLGRARRRGRLRPGDMGFAGAMAGLAADADFGLRGGVALRCGVEVLFDLIVVVTLCV